MIFQVVGNENVSQNYYKLTLDISQAPSFPVPGQFFNIKCGATLDPLLRRPFSMHRLIEQGSPVFMEILYLVIGRGTAWLSRRRPGEELDAIGPLGNGFDMSTKSWEIVLVARGCGIASEKGSKRPLRAKKRPGNLNSYSGYLVSEV